MSLYIFLEELIKELNEIIGNNVYKDGTFDEDRIIFEVFCNLGILKVLTFYDKDKKIFDIKGLGFQFKKSDIKKLSFLFDQNGNFKIINTSAQDTSRMNEPKKHRTKKR